MQPEPSSESEFFPLIIFQPRPRGGAFFLFWLPTVRFRPIADIHWFGSITPTYSVRISKWHLHRPESQA